MYYFFHNLMLLCETFTSGWRFNLLEGCLTLLPSTTKSKQNCLQITTSSYQNPKPTEIPSSGISHIYYKYVLWIWDCLPKIPALDSQPQNKQPPKKTQKAKSEKPSKPQKILFLFQLTVFI